MRDRKIISVGRKAERDLARIEGYLRTCRELNALCSQNGWIDNETLRVDMVEWTGQAVTASVTFDELIMKGGTGCVGRRLPRFGRVRIHLNSDGHVASLEVL